MKLILLLATIRAATTVVNPPTLTEPTPKTEGSPKIDPATVPLLTEPITTTEGSPKIDPVTTTEGSPKIDPITTTEGSPKIDPVTTTEGSPKIDPTTVPPKKEEEEIPKFVSDSPHIMEETGNQSYLGLAQFKFYLNNKAIIKNSLDLLFKEPSIEIKDKEKILSKLLQTFKTTKPLVVNDTAGLKYDGVVAFYNILEAHNVYSEIMKITTELRTNFEFLHFIVESGKKNGVFSKAESIPFSLACVNCEKILDELIDRFPNNKDAIAKWKNSLVSHFQNISDLFKEGTGNISTATKGDSKIPLKEIFGNHFNKNLVGRLNKVIPSLENLLSNILTGIEKFGSDEPTQKKIWEFCNYLLVAKSMAGFLSDLPNYQAKSWNFYSYTHSTASKISDLTLNLFAMSLEHDKKTYDSLKSCLSTKNFTWWKSKNVNSALSGDIQFIAEIHEGNINDIISQSLKSIVDELTNLKGKTPEEVSQSEIDALRAKSAGLSRRAKLLLEITSEGFKKFENDLKTTFETEVDAFEKKFKEGNKPKVEEEEVVIPKEEEETPPPVPEGSILGSFLIILALIAVIAAIGFALFGKKREEVLE